jgi:hypothetical protein
MSESSNLTRAIDITLAWLASPHTRADAEQAGAMLAMVHAAVERLANPAPVSVAEEAAPKPAVGAKASL